uniref:Uncharacterized protein n=1 Tax=Muribaculaceae bacterium Z82 TaxID=2304548 RepID=A0A7C9NVA6_9BACT
MRLDEYAGERRGGAAGKLREVGATPCGKARRLAGHQVAGAEGGGAKRKPAGFAGPMSLGAEAL